MDHRISIVMCTYNGAPHIRQQLDSLAAQTRLPDVLQVWDDSSSDNTVCLVRAWAAQAPFPVEVHIQSTNLGVIKNVQHGLAGASGDLMALCDQDDIWRSDKLQQAEAAFSANPQPGLVFSDAEAVGEDLQPLGYTLARSSRFSTSEQRMVHSGRSFDVVMRRNVVMGASLTVPAAFKSLILPIPSGEVQLHDEWIALLVAAVAPVSYIPEPLLLYRQVSGQQRGAHRPTGPAMLLDRFRTASYTANQARLASYVEWLSAARQRLAEHEEDYPLRFGVLEAIEAKQRHLAARLAMPRPRARRLPIVARELTNQGYHRYSIGIWDAARDLVA